jgi:hypothetical protein
MKKSTSLILYIAIMAGAVAAAPTLTVLQFNKNKLAPWPVKYRMTRKGVMNQGKVRVSITPRQAGKLKEWSVVVENKSSKTAKLCFRLSIPCGKVGGAFWDGFEIKGNINRTFKPSTKRYIFPAITYVKDGSMHGIGYAPMTVSSRFERHCAVNKGKVTLVFDSYMALAPGQKDQIYFISQTTKATDYTELVEQIYVAYPKWFNPIKGGDTRICGVGGYFFSDENHRDYQMEEARRFNFSWEWYYNCYQKAGNHYPLQNFWEDAKGYKSEPGSLFGKCDRPGTIKDWVNYNQERTISGNKNAAMLYYYLQQYCNSAMLKKDYPDSIWRDKKGGVGGVSFGWAEEGKAQYAWFRHSSLGRDIRKQLAMLWNEFPIAGFALDCAIGDTKYYGPLLKKETGKAFDDDGQVYATEGIGLAYNMAYTHTLPAKADGRKAVSVINEFYTWLPMLYADAAIHEMTPFDRADLLAPRRLIAGQKPYYFWKGLRADALLKWDTLTKAEAHEGITGFVDFTILSSFRFGIIPAVFYSKGFQDIHDLNPILKKLVASGWRAASYVKIVGTKDSIDPYAQKEDIWISRFGKGNESYIVLSAPDKKVTKGKARILTGKFGASGAIYADVNGNPIINQVKVNETIVNFTLKNRDPLILKKIGVLNSLKDCNIEASISVKEPGYPQLAKFKFVKQSTAKVIKSSWPQKSISAKEVVFEQAPKFTFVPNDKFIADIDLVTGKKVNAVIAVAPEDLKKNPDAVKLLEIYYEYYFMRTWRSVHRLAQIKPEWLNKKLRLPVLSPNDKKIKKAKIVFVVGAAAQKALLPRIKKQDAIFGTTKNKQLLVSVFPGKNNSTLDLVKQLLARMDEKYPYIGGVKNRWAIKIKLYGKTFKKNKSVK